MFSSEMHRIRHKNLPQKVEGGFAKDRKLLWHYREAHKDNTKLAALGRYMDDSI